MATFKCIRSGNTVTFENAYDIEQMRRQTLDYVEVIDGVANEAPEPSAEKTKTYKAKQRPYNGHPDKVAA